MENRKCQMVKTAYKGFLKSLVLRAEQIKLAYMTLQSVLFCQFCSVAVHAAKSCHAFSEKGEKIEYTPLIFSLITDPPVG